MDTTVRFSSSWNVSSDAQADPSYSPYGSGPLRIAMLAPPYFQVPPTGYGGVEAVIADLSDALAAQGHEVTLLGAGRSCGVNATFHSVWERCVSERVGDGVAEIAYTAAARQAVLRLAESGRFDVIHDHTVAGPLNAAAYAAAGLPSVMTVHNAIKPDLAEFYRHLGADLRMISISHRQRELAADLSWIATVHNGLRAQDWPFSKRKGDYALFLGRYNYDKGAHLALEAAHAAGLPLLLAAKCTEQVEKDYYANEVVPRLGPNDKVLGVADGPTKRQLLANARCLLFPILWEEPFGMVMIEAMACGTPVVALRGGAVTEVVTPGVNGIICEKPEELPQALDDVRALDPFDCRDHVEQRFSARRMAEGYLTAYRKAMAGHPSASPVGGTVLAGSARNGRRAYGDRPAGRERRPLIATPERRR